MGCNDPGLLGETPKCDGNDSIPCLPKNGMTIEIGMIYILYIYITYIIYSIYYILYYIYMIPH